MRKFAISYGLAILCLAAAGCTSYFTRKDCEKANWYQHGYDVAMSGKRLDADDYLKQCQKVNAQIGFGDADTGFKAGMAKYCTSDNIYTTGKEGKPFSYDLCDGESEHKMRDRYEAGLRVFCVPDNGYHYGATGSVYQNVCPKETEAAWLVQYRRGRKVYLAGMIQQKEQEQQQLNSEISSLEAERSSLAAQQSLYMNQTTVHHERTYDAATNSYRENDTVVPDENAKTQSQELGNQISNIDFQIQSSRQKQTALDEEVGKMRTEMISL